MTKTKYNEISLAEVAAENIEKIESGVRQMKYVAITQMIRALGERAGDGNIVVPISNGYHGAWVKDGNHFEEVTHLVLMKNENYEVFLYNMYNGELQWERDIEDFDGNLEFDTNIFGEKKEYFEDTMVDIMFYFLHDLTLAKMKAVEKDFVESED